MAYEAVGHESTQTPTLGKPTPPGRSTQGQLRGLGGSGILERLGKGEFPAIWDRINGVIISNVFMWHPWGRISV
jgi:hypothetical protein